MKNQPKVSLIVPVYNAEKWLPVSFRSFEGQTYSNTEWVLVDDGSVDGSAALCSKWCSVDPKKRRFVRKTNGARLQRAMLVSMRRLAIMCSSGTVMTSRTRRQSRRWLGVFLRPTGLRSAQYAVCCPMARAMIFLPANITLWSLMRLSANGSGGLYGSLLEACAKTIAHR